MNYAPLYRVQEYKSQWYLDGGPILVRIGGFAALVRVVVSTIAIILKTGERGKTDEPFLQLTNSVVEKDEIIERGGAPRPVVLASALGESAVQRDNCKLILLHAAEVRSSDSVKAEVERSQVGNTMGPLKGSLVIFIHVEMKEKLDPGDFRRVSHADSFFLK